MNRVTSENILINSKLHHACIQVAKEFFYCVGKGQKLKHQIVTLVCWVRPPLSWHKLNTDGASIGNPGKDGEGGVD